MSELVIAWLRRECTLSGTDFSSPAKCDKMSRCPIMADDFDWEAIWRHVYQLYQAKEHWTLSKLLVRNLSFVVLDVGNLFYLGYRKCCWEHSLLFSSGHRCRSCWTRCRRRVMKAPQHKSSFSSQETYTVGPMTQSVTAVPLKKSRFIVVIVIKMIHHWLLLSVSSWFF